MSDFVTVSRLLKEKGGYIRLPEHWYIFGHNKIKWEYGFAPGDRGLACYLVHSGVIQDQIPLDNIFNVFHIKLDDYIRDDWEHKSA